MNYDVVEENKRSIKVGRYELTATQDRGTMLWKVSCKEGPTPVSLRGRFTSAREVLTKIKDWNDGADARSATYKKEKEK